MRHYKKKKIKREKERRENKNPQSYLYREGSPGEGFLDKVNVGAAHLVPNGTADIVAQRPAPTDDNGHLAHLPLELEVQEDADVC